MGDNGAQIQDRIIMDEIERNWNYVDCTRMEKLMVVLDDVSRAETKPAWYVAPPVKDFFDKTPVYGDVFENGSMARVEAVYRIVFGHEERFVTIVFKYNGEDEDLCSLDYHFTLHLYDAIALVWSDYLYCSLAWLLEGGDLDVVNSARADDSEDVFMRVLLSCMMDIMYRGDKWANYFTGVGDVIEALKNNVHSVDDDDFVRCLLVVSLGTDSRMLVHVQKPKGYDFYLHAACTIREWDGSRPLYLTNTLKTSMYWSLNTALRSFKRVNTTPVLPSRMQIVLRQMAKTASVSLVRNISPARPGSPLKNSS